MKITIQYFDGCPHWKLADERVRHVLGDFSSDDVTLEYQFIDSPETADQLGFHGSPTILIDGLDPFITGVEQVGMTCRVFRTEDGVEAGCCVPGGPVTICVGPRLPEPASAPSPGGRRATVNALLFGLAPGGVCLVGRSPGRRWALTPPFHPYPTASLRRQTPPGG